jgi:ketosteroid isomerase-like protein
MSDPDTDLRAALATFMSASDRGDHEAVAQWYADDFVCHRVPDHGDAVRLPRQTMLDIFARQAVPTNRTGTTTVDSVEVIDGMGIVVLRRNKDFGDGDQTMFYCLIWRRGVEGQWRLVREYVHQRQLPVRAQ